MNTGEALMILDGFDSFYESDIALIIEAAEHLVNTGAAYTLPGRVGRMCRDILNYAYEAQISID